MGAVKDAPLASKGFEGLTTTASPAKALTLPKEARLALIQAETASVRWRDDGVDPTATVGMILLATSDGIWFAGDLKAFRVIEAVAANGAKLNVTYYA